MQRISVKNATEQQIAVGNAQTIIVEHEPYGGVYVVTPSVVQQTLLTKNKSMGENVVIEPIPSNYGLITYNGFELTVS